MKNLYYLVCFILLSIQILAQTPDWKWYIKDSAIIQNFIPNNYGAPTQISSFALTGVAAPSLSGNNYIPSDQLFVIYTDSSFSIKNVSYDISGIGKVNLITNQLIKCMYWTDKYDFEDPPSAITTSNSVGSNIPITNTLSMIVHQNAVPERDVVVIIPRSYYTDCKSIRFTYDTSVFGTLNLFDHLPLFPYNLEDLTTPGEINLRINNGLKYSFIALKTKGINVGYNDSTTLYLNCLDHANTYLDSLRVPILKAHDPNYIKVQCVSLPQNNINTVKYEVACFNDGVASAVNPEIKMKLPSQLNANTVCIDSYYIGGTKYGWLGSPNKLTYSLIPGNKIVFRFIANLDPNQGASIQFCVKGKPDVNLLNAGISLEPTQDFTMFNLDLYSIVNFYDIKKGENDRSPSVCNCKCKKEVKNHCLVPWFNRKKKQ